MGDKEKYTELAKQAQAGDEESMNRLAELVREPLRIYVGRLTLDYDLTQDIVQESLLEMFRFLDKLEKVDRFWPWLLRIATSKFKDNYERQRRRKTASTSQIPQIESEGKDVAFENLIGQELKQLISGAMSALRPRHRTVLALRCYEEMAYSQIAEVMGCSEFGARMLFFRAKKALAKQLSRRGLGKGSLLLALALFGKMTAPGKAAAAQISVTAVSTKVGVMATVAANCTGKAAIVFLTCAGLLAIGSMVAKPPSNEVTTPVDNFARVPGVVVRTRESSEEYWYYYPSSVNGPLMTRVMRGDSRGQELYCQYMQDDTGNYYYDKRKNTVHINNWRLWRRDLSVWRLPTDKPELTQFLSEVEGQKEHMQHVTSNREGLMVVATLRPGDRRLWTTHHYHVLNEEYFRYNWPAGTELVDKRDRMHKRGWTYFRITGELNGEKVLGTGRIPFVYASSKQNYPWLRVEVGNRLQIADNAVVAWMCDASGKTVARYIGGALFKGLNRPWMGLHTLDIIRRDAAERNVSFETKLSGDEAKAEVVLTCQQTKLIYTIDMEKDVIEKIMFLGSEGQDGELRFSYLQEMGQTATEFVVPKPRASGRLQQSSPGMLWLSRLVEGKTATE